MSKNKMNVEEKMSSFNNLQESIEINELIGKNAKIKIINSDRNKENFKDIDGNKTDFIMLIQSMALMSAEYLLPSSCKIMLYLLGKTEFKNRISISIKQIINGTKLSKRTVITALHELEHYNVIEKEKETDDVDKRYNSYLVNPYLAWKGISGDRKPFILKNIKKEKSKMFTQPQFDFSKAITTNISEENA